MEMTPKKSSNKWLVGLGIGCGGVVLIAIIITLQKTITEDDIFVWHDSTNSSSS
jgi:hypothetical protein